MPLGTEVNLGPVDVVLDGVVASLKVAQPPVYKKEMVSAVCTSSCSEGLLIIYERREIVTFVIPTAEKYQLLQRNSIFGNSKDITRSTRARLVEYDLEVGDAMQSGVQRLILSAPATPVRSLGVLTRQVGRRVCLLTSCI